MILEKGDYFVINGRSDTTQATTSYEFGYSILAGMNVSSTRTEYAGHILKALEVCGENVAAEVLTDAEKAIVSLCTDEFKINVVTKDYADLVRSQYPQAAAQDTEEQQSDPIVIIDSIDADAS